MLLPVLLEEHGPTIGFPAAMFCIANSHGNTSDIESFARFLEPLTCCASAVTPDTVKCVGVCLDVDTYTDLKMELDASIFSAISDILARHDFSILLSFETNFRLPLRTILSDPRLADLRDNPPSVILAPDTATHFADIFRARGWTLWADALSNCY